MSGWRLDLARDTFQLSKQRLFLCNLTLCADSLRLQMTGYMLRNAEYVLMLRRLFRLKTRSASEYREAFDRVDLDGSGFIDAKEIETLLSEVYPSDGVPAFEIKSFLGLFDADGDGKVGWDE